MRYEIINYTCNLISVMQVSILCLIQAIQASPVELYILWAEYLFPGSGC